MGGPHADSSGELARQDTGEHIHFYPRATINRCKRITILSEILLLDNYLRKYKDIIIKKNSNLTKLCFSVIFP